ncbi:MAG: Bacterial antitoxin of ParD toxin-antitoxin type system [Rhodospirillales bacterium]|jgi:Arc/MetJ-type ribon-helix-helix transcriptional regulator|nr:Bacterial antitoxin of ParD toxin-antitoxin type system [Rhodospirillales bacterium]MDB5383446.1 Bacterial antitoxin of ParD toxin-antitoxin type system [Rhodospirillales bacterium]
MAEATRMTLTLSKDLAELLTEVVATGDYANRGEVVRDALRQWQEKRTQAQFATPLRTRGKEIWIK